MLRLFLIFLLGAATDALWVWWMCAATGGKPIAGAAVSMILGAAGIYGMGQALTHRWRAVALVLGYGCGSFLATLVASRG